MELLKVSIIIQAQNEESTIGDIIKEMKKLKPYEIIIVLNGSTDKTSYIVKSLGCKLIEYEKPLGINVGKALGANKAIGDILVFIDSDIVIQAKKILPYIIAIQNGADVVLNDLTWTMYRNTLPHPTAVSKRALNIFLKREDLLVNTMGSIPNALSRHAVNKIGWWNLIDPPLVQAICVEQNLIIEVSEPIDVIYTNKIRPKQHYTLAPNSPYPQSTSRVIGDHLKAINYMISKTGVRNGFYDGRNRKLLDTINVKKKRKNVKRSVVISCEGKSKYLIKLVKSIRQNVDEIIIVGYQLNPLIIKRVKKMGAIIFNYPQSIGVFMTRAIGAAHSNGKVILFIDSNLQVSTKEMMTFIKSVENGVDIALNNNDYLLNFIHPIDTLSAIKYFLNLSIKQPTLLNNSLVTVPHAIHRSVINKVGINDLCIPPLFYLKALMNNYKIESPYSLKLKQNYDVSSERLNDKDKYKALDIFLGDHIEAINYYLKLTNNRGGFTDGNKNRSLIKKLKGKTKIDNH